MSCSYHIKLMFFLIIFVVIIIPGCNTLDTDLPRGDEDLSFVVFSDTQQGFGIYSMLASNIGKIEPAPIAAFCLGDIMLRPGNELEWLNFWYYSNPITEKMPIYIARGNHEGNEASDEYALRHYGRLSGDNFYYFVQHEDLLFLILDTEIKGEEEGILGEQLAWMKKQLDSAAAAPGIENIFIFLHRPLYPQGFHQGSNLLNADTLHQIFLLNKKIRVVFSGHDHFFNCYLKDGMHYITTGGAGGPLYHGNGGDYHHFIKVSIFRETKRINLKSIGIFNEVVEDFDI